MGPGRNASSSTDLPARPETSGQHKPLGTSLDRTARRAAVVVSLGVLLVAALTSLAAREWVVVSVAGFAAVVAIIYLVRVSRGAFDPYGSIALLVWTVVNVIPPEEAGVSVLCTIGIAYVLVNCASRRLAERKYAKFMARANSVG